MKINKKLTSWGLVVAAALVIGLGMGNHSRKDHSQYDFDGKIGEDEVSFTEVRYDKLSDDNVLTVKKPNGNTIKYLDILGEDLKLEYVSIKVDGRTTTYKNDVIGKPVLEAAQKQYDNYLVKILEAKTNKGLEALE